MNSEKGDIPNFRPDGIRAGEAGREIRNVPFFWEVMTKGPEETVALGAAIGRRLRAGDFVALRGALGAGKTQLVKGLAAGLGVPPEEPVVSPTFVLVREYAGRLKLYHIDAYRLHGLEELLALGVEEMTRETGAVVALEWADRVPGAAPAEALLIDLEHGGANTRRVRLEWDAARLDEIIGDAIRD